MAKNPANTEDIVDIRKVPWRLRDVVKVIILSFLIPFGILLIVIGLSHFGLLPDSVREMIRNDDMLVDTVFTVISLVVEFGLLAWLLRKYNASWTDLGLRKFSWWKALIYIIGGLFIFSGLVAGIFLLITAFVPSIDVNEAQEVGFEFGRSGVGLWASAFVTVICAPIIEELYFRGLLMPSLAKRWGFAIAILSSSALFALLHGQANVIIYTFILGCILSLFYIRLKSIIPGIALHMLNNALAFVVIAGLIK